MTMIKVAMNRNVDRRARKPDGTIMEQQERRSDLTAEEVRYWLNYDPETGLFTWAHMSSRKRPIGSPAGYMDGHGYVGIRLCSVCHAAHRLAWLWMTGEWPEHEIDHINCTKTDNRWVNLRAATRVQNSVNLMHPKSHNRSGVKGVWWAPSREKWRVAIRINGVATHLGYFDDIEAGRAAYNAASIKLHGEFGRPA